MEKALRFKDKNTFFAKFAKNKLALISLVFILLEILMVIVLPPIMGLDPYTSTVF